MNMVLDGPAMGRSLTRIAHEILESTQGTEDLVLVGIINRGDTLARLLAVMIKQIEGVEVPVVHLDITNFRDDARPASSTADAPVPDLTGRRPSSSTTSSTPGAPRAPPWTRFSQPGGRPASGSRSSSTAGIANCLSAQISWAERAHACGRQGRGQH